jgi:hypothetical protein
MSPVQFLSLVFSYHADPNVGRRRTTNEKKTAVLFDQSQDTTWDHKPNEEIREKPGLADIGTIIKL